MNTAHSARPSAVQPSVSIGIAPTPPIIGFLSFGGQVLLAPDGDRLPYAVSVAKTRTYLGAWLRAARESRGWTQDRLGDALGVTKQNVYHWETGKHEPSFEQILRIRDLTGHPLRDISAAIDWPLARIPRERITSLTPEQIEQLQAGLIGILAAITKDPELGGGSAPLLQSLDRKQAEVLSTSARLYVFPYDTIHGMRSQNISEELDADEARGGGATILRFQPRKLIP